MIRLFDLILAVLASLILAIPYLIISLVIKITSKGPVLYWSARVGKNNTLFQMPKFRTMQVNTPIVATHLLESPEMYLTPVGSFLRKSSLDEIPQLWNILKGQMTFVGPRPALFNQADLIMMRTCYGVHQLSPGLTGWAQINGRDELSVEQKVKLDFEYSQKRSLLFNFKILWLTILKVFWAEGIHH